MNCRFATTNGFHQVTFLGSNRASVQSTKSGGHSHTRVKRGGASRSSVSAHPHPYRPLITAAVAAATEWHPNTHQAPAQLVSAAEPLACGVRTWLGSKIKTSTPQAFTAYINILRAANPTNHTAPAGRQPPTKKNHSPSPPVDTHAATRTENDTNKKKQGREGGQRGNNKKRLALVVKTHRPQASCVPRSSLD